MTALVEMLVPALALSGLAAGCLALLPNAPPQTRLVIALAGLAAWVVPWPWMSVSLPVAGALAARALVEVAALTSGLGVLAERPGADVGVGVGYIGYSVYGAALLFALGLLWFIADCLALRAAAREWRARSRGGDALRTLLPAELRGTRAQVRIVRGTRVAAASGWLRPTVWIGDRFASTELRLALTHEFWHVRRGDPIRIALITAVRRAYWWNPIVAYLAREALLMVESACDRRCAARFGTRRYVEGLAAMMLDAGHARSPRLVATVRSASLNVQRLRLLHKEVRLRVRDCALIGLLAVVGTVVAAGAIADSSPTRLPTAVPATAVQPTLLEAFHDGDVELLHLYVGAFTPQEIPLPPEVAGEIREADRR